MKNIITAFLKTYTATKIGIIASSVVFIGVATMSTIYVMGAEKETKQETVITSSNVEEIEKIIEVPQEILNPETEQEETPEPEEEAEEEDKTPPKVVKYQDKTVTVPKSTVASVNSSEDAEKDKKKGGEEVKQEQVEEMFENVGKKSMGIDVSAHQGKINWSQVKQSGVEFAMIRVGFRGQTEGKIYEDTYFKANVSGAIANGIKVGIYFYSTAINDTEALEEAAWVVNKIAPYSITYPVVYDFEDFGRYRCTGVDGNVATKNALTFLNYVKSQGYEPMMYANKNDITRKMSRSSFSCKFWLAHYTEETDYKGSFNMWQYTSKGSVPGISGRVDMNIAYFTYGTVADAKHTHNYTSVVGKVKEATCTEEGSKTLRCSCGETKTETINKLNHKFGEWQVETAATTESAGVEKRVCDTCKKEETKIIPKLENKPVTTPSETPKPSASPVPTPEETDPPAESPKPTTTPTETPAPSPKETLEPSQTGTENKNTPLAETSETEEISE